MRSQLTAAPADPLPHLPQVVMDYFNRKIEEGVAAQGAAAEMSADLVLSIVKRHSQGWHRDRLRPFPELRFTYEEGEPASKPANHDV